MKAKPLTIAAVVLGVIFLFAQGACCQGEGKVTMEQWIKILESKRTGKPVHSSAAETGKTEGPSESGERHNAPGTPVTIYWHIADDADVYLNGVPLRRYEPSFKTRGDEAPLPAFFASASLKNGDVFTVGGRRGGSYGFMLIAVDAAGRVVFKTDRRSWKVYLPGERNDWYLPNVASASPTAPVTVQPNPWHPQQELNRKYGHPAVSIWGPPSAAFAYLTATVTLASGGADQAGAGASPLLLERFSSGLSSLWEPLQVVGGNFQRFASMANSRLTVAVPAGHSWGKTGLMSRAPLFQIRADMADRPLSLTFAFAPQETTGYIIALSQVKDADVWRVQNVWFHWGKPTPAEGKAYLVNTQNSGDKGDETKTPADAPQSVTLAVRPGAVEAMTSHGTKMAARIAWLKEGTPVYVYVFSHPWNQNEAASFVLTSIKMVQ